MAEKLADLSPEEQEKRKAELKARMQASAQKAKATASSEAPKAVEAPARAAPAAKAAAAVAVAEPPPKSKAGVEAPSNGAGHNGAAVAVAPKVVADQPVFEEETPEARARKAMNRREFLTYAWGATLGLLLLQTGVGTFFFMYPRFKAGEFGGVFFIGPESALPPIDAPPTPYTAGKFWLVNTEDQGPLALYMVCTHLGCLYKWAQSNHRFECPCHGSKFSRDGYYIEGPAPRSLDTFAISVENGEVAVDTGKKVSGAPALESPVRVAPT